MFRKVHNKPRGACQFLSEHEELTIGDESNVETTLYVDLNQFPDDYPWGVDPEDFWRNPQLHVEELLKNRKPIFRRASLQGFGVDILTYLLSVQPSVISDYDDLNKYVSRIQEKSTLSQDQILRLYILQHMYRDKPVVHSLYVYRRLRILDILHWCTATEARVKLDLLGRLTWPDRFISPNTELGVICLKMDEESRRYFAAFYMHALASVTSIVSTIDFQIFEGQPAADDEVYQDLALFEAAVDEYCDDKWNTLDMSDQSLCPNNIFFGFIRMVNEVMKLLADEIVNDVTHETGSALNFKNKRVRIQQLKERLDICSIIVIEEFFKFFMSRYTVRMSVDDALLRLLPRATNMYRWFTERMRITRREDYSTFPENRLRGMFAKSILGELTLGEQVEFTPLTLKPIVFVSFAPQTEAGQTLNFTANTFLRRCRFSPRNRCQTITAPDNGRITIRDDFPIQFFRQGRPIGQDQVDGTEEELNSFLESGTAVPSPWTNLMGPFNGAFEAVIEAALEQAFDNSAEDLPSAQPPPQNTGPVGSSSAHAAQAQAAQAVPQTPTPAVATAQEDEPPPPYQESVDQWPNIPSTPWDPDQVWGNLADDAEVEGQEGETRELTDYTFFEEDYHNDIEESDNEHEVYADEDRVRDSNYNPIGQTDMFESFYKEITSWLINPADNWRDGHINGSPKENAHWIINYFRRDGRFFLRQATHAANLTQYKNHMKAFSMLSVRATVVDKMQGNEFTIMRQFRENFIESLRDHSLDIPFAEMEVENSSCTQHLVHGQARSDDAQQNRYLFDECMRGLTLCMAYIERGDINRRTPIPPNSPITRPDEDTSACMFMLIRRMSIRSFTEQDILERDPQDTAIEHINVRFTLNREVLRKQGFFLQSGMTIRFMPVCSLASELRIAKAIERVEELPRTFLQRLFGPTCTPVMYTPEEVRNPPSNSHLTLQAAQARLPTTANRMRTVIRDQCDPGSLRYAIRCLHNDGCRVERTHFNALVQTIRTLGSGDAETSGMSMVQGPPGTGKTNNLNYVIGALMHHSVYGHIVPVNHRVRYPRTPTDDLIHRRSNLNQSFRIMVVASSNVAVDNALMRVHREGIPDGNGGFIHPQMLRLARQDYIPKEAAVNQYLLRNAARYYDEDHADRGHPTLTAKRQRASECILFFSTSSAVGSAQFKELNQHIDIVLHDEAAQSLETETLIPLTAANSNEGYGRLFYFGFGDGEQLDALTFIPNMLYSSHTLRYAPFHIKTIKMSMFERLIYSNRVTVSFLSAQFRMHPAISRSTSVPYYNCHFACPLGRDPFVIAYNQPAQHPNAFYPMTFLDTAALLARGETSGENGVFTNQTESNLVTQVIRRIYNTVPEDTLDGQIAVIAPYRSQVQNITHTLLNRLPGHNNENTRRRRNIMVCTVDSMQGSQRDVVIFTTTRSNREGKVGFVREPKRLNVSVSRARKLNIIITDHSTIDKRGRYNSIFGIQSFCEIYETCATGRHDGARLAKVTLNRNYIEGGDIPPFNIAYRPIRTASASTRAQSNHTDPTNRQGPFQGPTANQAPQELEFVPTYYFADLYPAADSPL